VAGDVATHTDEEQRAVRMILAAALAVLPLTTAHAKFEPEKAYGLLVQLAIEECRAKPDAVPDIGRFGPITARQIRRGWEAQCISGGITGARTVVDGYATGRFTKQRLSVCADRMQPDVTSFHISALPLRLALCAGEEH
jgi:hypothetical protein